MTDIADYQFKNPLLLEEALTHPSYSADNNRIRQSYERLEFLGDSVLGLVISEMLFEIFPDENEGALAKRRAAVVCGESLSKVAETINIGQKIRMSGGEEANGGRNNVTNLENALEALIGAIYLDGGLGEAEKFVKTHFGELVKTMAEPPKDPKTTLQEWAQAKGLPVPIYETIEQTGPSHAPVFTIQAKINGLEPVQAKGASKKKAERDAAQLMLERITNL